jgi:hypothetical protein
VEVIILMPFKVDTDKWSCTRTLSCGQSCVIHSNSMFLDPFGFSLMISMTAQPGMTIPSCVVEMSLQQSRIASNLFSKFVSIRSLWTV